MENKIWNINIKSKQNDSTEWVRNWSSMGQISSRWRIFANDFTTFSKRNFWTISRHLAIVVELSIVDMYCVGRKQITPSTVHTLSTMFGGISVLNIYLRISQRGCVKSSRTLYGLLFCTFLFPTISTLVLCLESRTMIGLGFEDLLPIRCERLMCSGLRSPPISSLTKFKGRISVSSRVSVDSTLLSGMP